MVDSKVEKLGRRSADARRVMNYLYKRPIIEMATVSELIEKTPQTAYTLISELEKMKIIREVTGSQRNKLYVFSDYMDLF